MLKAVIWAVTVVPMLAHQAGCDEADDHNVRGRGALHEDRDGNTCQNGSDLILGRFSQNDLKVVAAGVLEAARHDRHTVKEQAYAAQQYENIID